MERNQDYFFDQSDPDFLFFDEPSNMSNIESSATDVALRRILQSQQPTSQPALREGKLYITVQGLSGPKTNLFLSLFRGFACKVSLDNFSHIIPIQFSSINSNSPKCLIFDVFEYFGPSSLMFTIQSKGLFVTEDLGSKNISLYDIFLLQEKKEASRNYLTTLGGEVKEEKYDTVNSLILNPIMPKKSYWGCDGIIHIDSKSGNSSLSATRVGRSGFTLSFQARFVQLHRSLNLGLFVLGGERYSELHHAAASGTVVIMKHLIESLGNKEALRTALALRTTKGLSVLDVSISSCNLDITRFLLQRVGNLCFQGITKQSSSPLHHAVQSGDQEVLRILLRFLHRYRTVIYSWEATSSYSDMLDWKDAQDRTPLMLACSLGNNETVQILLKAGSDPAVTTTANKRTALMFAAIAGSVEVCNTLLAETVSPSAQKLLKGQQQVPLASLRCLPCAGDSEGYQAIMHAAAQGRSDVVEALLLAHIPFSDVNKDGDSCCHIAATRGHVEVCRVLIAAEKREWLEHVTLVSTVSLNRMQYRAKHLMTKNTFGRRPVDLARAAGHGTIAALLEEAVIEIYGSAASNQRSGNLSESDNGNSITSAASYGLYSTDRLTDFESDDVEYELALLTYSTKYDPSVFERDNAEVKGDNASKEQDESVTTKIGLRDLELALAKKHDLAKTKEEIPVPPIAHTITPVSSNNDLKIKKSNDENQSNTVDLTINNIFNNKYDNNENIVESTKS